MIIHKQSINQSQRYIKDGYRFEHKKQLMKRLLITYLTHVDKNKKKSIRTTTVNWTLLNFPHRKSYTRKDEMFIRMDKVQNAISVLQ